MPLLFQGLWKEGFVGLDDAALVFGDMSCDKCQEAMPPAKSGVLADAASCCRPPYGQTFDQRLL
jgi:hypothetical protein